MKYGGGVLYNLVFTEWRHCVSQNEVWGRGCYITFFSPSDVTAFYRIQNFLLYVFVFVNELLSMITTRWFLSSVHGVPVTRIIINLGPVSTSFSLRYSSFAYEDRWDWTSGSECSYVKEGFKRGNKVNEFFFIFVSGRNWVTRNLENNVPKPPPRAPFYQAEKIRARINSSFAFEDR